MKYLSLIAGLFFISQPIFSQQHDDLIDTPESIVIYDGEPGIIDTEYENQKTDKFFLYTYIEKRTLEGLDNADVIDQYVSVIPHTELIKTTTLNLLLERNKYINANGAFYRFAIDNQDKIKNILNLKDVQFYQILSNAVDYTFDKACKVKDETFLNAAITAKLALLSISDEGLDIIKNEYLAKFYYTTEQPLLLANTVAEYANTILTTCEQQELKKNEKPVSSTKANSRALFLSALSGNKYAQVMDDEQIDVAYSLKLRDAAQYVVERLSNKTMLNNALTWSQKAIELFDDFSNYETHACLLYKLGKRYEAIITMEKAYASAPVSDENTSVKEKLGVKLIKMKRGERIY